MRELKFLKSSLLAIFLCTVGLSTAQEQFTQFTYYDQIHWSPNGLQLVFRCVLLDESRPEILRTHVLLKDLSSEQLICLNPQPERFVISADKKRLLFSSIYGLYLMNLDHKGTAVQLYFRDPAASWLFQDFGFYEDSEKIYINRLNPFAGETFEENFKIQTPQFTAKSVTASSLEKLTKKVKSRFSNLSLESLSRSRDTELKLKESVLKFTPVKDSQSEFNLVTQSGGNRSQSKNLIKNCRPRILSQSPDERFVIVSVFLGNSHTTYLYSTSTNNITELNAEQMLSISWLSPTQYICTTEKGLFLRDVKLRLNQKLNEFELPDWCKPIELTLPQYELQVGFENDKSKAEHVLSKLNQMGFDGRLIFHKNRFQTGYRIRIGGFTTKKAARIVGEKLQQNGYKFWVDKISDVYDFINRTQPDESQSFKKKKAFIQYKKNGYLRSRILLTGESGRQQILVNEMNNIPNRSVWK